MYGDRMTDSRSGESPSSAHNPQPSALSIKEVWNDPDFEHVLDIRDEVFVNEQHLTDDARNDPEDDRSIHFLAYLDSEPIGTGRLTMYGHEAQVAWVAVREGYRGTGVGNVIMRTIIDRASTAGAGYVMLNAQTHAIRFYERLGFESVGAEFYMGGIGHVVMVRRF